MSTKSIPAMTPLQTLSQTHHVFGQIDDLSDAKSSARYCIPLALLPSMVADEQTAAKARAGLRVAVIRKVQRGRHGLLARGKNTELTILQQVTGHPNIETLKSFDMKGLNWFTTEARSTVSLTQFADNHGEIALPQQFLWHLLRQGASVLASLHFGVAPDHQRGGQALSGHVPITHNAIWGNTMLIAPPQGDSVFPDLIVTDFSDARSHPRGSVPPEGAAEDVANLSCALHYAAHRRQYGDHKDRDSDSYCRCFEGDRPNELAMMYQHGHNEFLGILNACVDPRSKHQFQSKALLEYLSPRFIQGKTADADMKWTVARLGNALAEEAEDCGDSVFSILNAGVSANDNNSWFHPTPTPDTLGLYVEDADAEKADAEDDDDEQEDEEDEQEEVSEEPSFSSARGSEDDRIIIDISDDEEEDEDEDDEYRMDTDDDDEDDTYEP